MPGIFGEDPIGRFSNSCLQFDRGTWRAETCCDTLNQFLYRLADAGQRYILSQHLHSFKQRRGVLAAAHSHADGLKHLSGLESEFLRGGAQSVVKWVVFK